MFGATISGVVSELVSSSLFSSVVIDTLISPTESPSIPLAANISRVLIPLSDAVTVNVQEL